MRTAEQALAAWLREDLSAVGDGPLSDTHKLMEMADAIHERTQSLRRAHGWVDSVALFLAAGAMVQSIERTHEEIRIKEGGDA